MNHTEHFTKLADYNSWANSQVYAAAAAMSSADRRRDVGIFFKSVQGTLHHLIATDNAWISLLSGQPIVPVAETPDAPLALLATRRAELDLRLHAMVASMSTRDFETFFSYTPWSGDFKGLLYNQHKKDVLTHLFNHHTHHRGHVHAALSILGATPPALDLFALQITGGRLAS